MGSEKSIHLFFGYPRKARELKDTDTKNGESGKCIVLTQDVQAVKVCPSLNESALYYKKKLSCHNFTVHNNITHQVYCYWFTEIDADLTANTFASCIVDYLLNTIVANTLPVVIWSDGCSYQNKNATVSNALLSLNVEKKYNYLSKVPRKGPHSDGGRFGPCCHRKKTGQKAYLFVKRLSQIALEARCVSKYGPYEVKPISFDFVKDYGQKKTLKFESIRPGKKVSDPTVNDIKMIKYTPDGNIQVQLSFDENEPFQNLPQRQNGRRLAKQL